jgi:hypothetical protein
VAPLDGCFIPWAKMEVEEVEVGKNRAEEDAVGKNRAEEDAVGKNRRPQGASATAHANDSAVHTPPPPASALGGAAQGSSTEMVTKAGCRVSNFFL